MLRRTGLVLLLTIGLLWASHAYLLRGVANWLDVTDPRFPTDYVVVLPGGPETRNFAAAVILRENLADRVAILRNPTNSDIQEGLSLPVHVLTQRILQKRGIADERMEFLDGESLTTHSDLELIGSLLQHQPDATVTIVTDRYHTRRARWAAGCIYGDQADRFSFVGTETDSFPWDRWWQSQHGLELVTAEYLKLAYYLTVYSTIPQRIAAVTVAIGGLSLAGGLLYRRRLHHRLAHAERG